MGESSMEDFEFVGVPESIGWPQTSGGIKKVEVHTVGYGPDANVQKRRLSAFRFKKDTTEDQPYVAVLESAVKDKTPLFFKGYRRPVDSGNGYYYTFQSVKVWDGAEQPQSASSQASAPSSQPPAGPSQSFADANLALATWAISTVLENLDRFPEVTQPRIGAGENGEDLPPVLEDKAERGKWVRATSIGLMQMARQISAPPNAQGNAES